MRSSLTIERRPLLALSFAALVGALAGCTDMGKMAQERSAEATDLALEVFNRDVDQLRKGMPEGAKILGQRLPADPVGSRAEVQTAIKAARDNVKELSYAKSTFFSYASKDGLVLRSEIDPDRLVDQNVLKVFPSLSKALEPNGGLVEAYGEMDALRGVKKGTDIAWIVAHGVNGADGAPQGLFLSGWSMRLYVGFVQDSVRSKIDEKTKDSSNKVEMYLFVVKGKTALGHPDAPDVHAEELVKQDVAAKASSGEFRTQVEMEGKTWGIVAKKCPAFGDDAVVAAISTIY
ncbi:MAG: hypothetical protein HOW73_12900 [Polyangiaceae bacterium]|nr:hypothetical protein [Polyangiaceae bacterium]